MSFGNQPGQVRFEDVTDSSGITRQGQTWGITLYDYNNDGLVDIFQNNHQHKPVSLFLNQGDGTFVDIASQVLPDGAPGDFHGAIGIDYDNNGVQELFQVAGGDLGASETNPNKNNRFFVRQGNQFVDIGEALGINYPLGRGRMPLPFDFNDDGKLDIIYTGPARPDGQSAPTLFLQTNSGFVNSGPRSGLATDVPNGTFSVLGDLNGDNRQELIYVAKNPKIIVYETSGLPLNDITSSILPSSLLTGVTNIKDIAIGDFNGDTFQDVLIIQQGTSTSGYRLDTNKTGKAKLALNRSSKSLSFKTSGNLSLNFANDPNLEVPSYFLNTTLTASDIYIGSRKINPASLVLNLNSNNASYQGMPSFRAGVDRGVFMGFDPNTNQWTVSVSSPTADEFNFTFETELALQANAGKSNDIMYDGNGDGRADRINLSGKAVKLLSYDSELGRLTNTSSESFGGSIPKIAGSSVVAADFDNDGDLDLFFVATANTENLPDELYENVAGVFRKVPNAAGSTGISLGIGDAVATADYDVDGFLDLVVTNGDVLGFDRAFWVDGTNRLFKNSSNGNHWIQIDLEGTQSNRDAVGATVYITTPDGKRQVREQNAGVHNRAQNSTRLHFGLADQTTISRLEVIWPNGQTQIFRNVQADRVIQLQENRDSITTVFSPDPPTADLDVLGTNQNDNLKGSEFDNVMKGFAGDDQLKGLDGNDTLIAGNGNDYLVGGRGNDVLTGGPGQDDFVFVSQQQRGDRITDFMPDTDDILIGAKGFRSGLEVGFLPSNRFVLGSRASDSRDRFIYDRNQGRLWFDPDGSGGKNASLLVTFENSPMLRSVDILVV